MKLVFETTPYKSYLVRAYYMEENDTNALVELIKGNEIVLTMHPPAYRIWNYYAHSGDLIDEYLVEREGSIYEKN